MKMHKMNELLKILALVCLWLSFSISTMEKMMLTDSAKQIDVYGWKVVWMLSIILVFIRKIFKGSFTPGEWMPAQKRHSCPKNCLKVEQLQRNQNTFITMNTPGWVEWATISWGCRKLKKEWDQVSLAERRSLDSCTTVCMNLQRKWTRTVI